MTKDIKKIAVIGAGAMGSGIAAQAANAGFEVVLLDKFEGVADKAVARMKKATNPEIDPFNATFMDPSNAKLISTGTTDDNMDMIADCDVVIEAVFERLDIKHATFKAIYEHARPDAIVTSNTSTIQIQKLVEDMPDDFKRRFMNTHFFNPPRFMKLLELIDGAETDKESFDLMAQIGDVNLGKKVVRCKDTPGFIANRIGTYAFFRAMKQGMDMDMPIEDIDSIMNMSLGFTKMGMMKLSDTVGVDIVKHVGMNLHDGLAADDHFNTIYRPDLVDRMVEDGYTGKKGKGGFYRIVQDEDGNSVKEVIDLKTGEYRAAKKSEYFKKNFKKDFGNFPAFFDSEDAAAKYAWPVLRDTLIYALDHAEEIAYDIQSVDDAMKAGYNWKWGPFELLDQFGVEWFTNRLQLDGIEVPALLNVANKRPFYRVEENKLQVMSFAGIYHDVKREDGVLNLSDIKRGSTPVLENDSAKLWDIGDGVVCLEFTSKANTLDPSILYLMNETIKLIEGSEGKYKALVIHNESPNFSVGANLGLVAIFNKIANHKITKVLGLSGLFNKWVNNFVEDMVYSGQAVMKALRESSFPVISAPNGKVLGGGAEVLLHSDGVQAGAETYIGLVEAGVGLLPAWGGIARYLERSGDFVKNGKGPKGPMQVTMKTGMAIADPFSSVSTSAQNAKKKLWMRSEDRVSMNADRLLADAKEMALSMAENYTPPTEPVYNLPGKQGKAALRMNVDTMYLKNDDPKMGVNHVDVAVVDSIADAVSGGETLDTDEIDVHVVEHQEHLKKMAGERENGKLNVNPTITLTEARILQLERDNFMTRFATKETKKRIGYTVAKSVPLREDRLDPQPQPKEIRDGIKHIKTKLRSPDGKPLSGSDEKRLHGMHKTTQRVIRTAKKLGLV